MDFLTVRELRTSTKSILDKLEKNGEMVVTNNGKPVALMLSLTDGEFDNMSRAVRQARAIISINNMRMTAAENGYMTDDEIEAEIKAARREINGD